MKQRTKGLPEFTVARIDVRSVNNQHERCKVSGELLVTNDFSSLRIFYRFFYSKKELIGFCTLFRPEKSISEMHGTFFILLGVFSQAYKCIMAQFSYLYRCVDGSSILQN